MMKLILCCILEVIDFLCFNFELMKNPFDQFSNTIPNATCNFLLVSRNEDFLEPLFVMSYLKIWDRWDWMDCTTMLYSENTSSVPIFKTWRISFHTFLGQFYLQKNVLLSVLSICKFWVAHFDRSSNLPSYLSWS